MEYMNHHRNNEFYICKRLRLLEFLRDKGFIPIQTQPDIKNPRYYVWIFKNTPELADAVEAYLIQQANRIK